MMLWLRSKQLLFLARQHAGLIFSWPWKALETWGQLQQSSRLRDNFNHCLSWCSPRGRLLLVIFLCLAFPSIACHRVASYYILLHWIIITLYCTVLRCIASHRIASHRIASHRIASHRIASHRIASHCMTLHCIAFHCVLLRCAASYRIGCIALNYIFS